MVAAPSENTKRLFLLDAMALIYRAHFAFMRSPIKNSAGKNTSAHFGFLNTLLDIIEKHAPTHLGVAFDTSAPTVRHEYFRAYKAQRDAMPEDIATAIPEIKALLRAFNIPVIQLDGYEADDIIGTLASRADQTGGFHTYMVTPDKDYAQLVSATTTMWKPGRKGSDAELLDLDTTLAQWEISSPSQVRDILGLWGDASDNIPGVPGIGEKNAKKLIATYHSVEQLLESTHELKGKQQQNLIEFAEQARLSKKLATILTDCPIEVSLDDLKLGEKNDTELRTLLTELEFNTLGKRILGESFHAGRGHSTTDEGLAKKRTHADTKTSYTAITTPAALDKLITQLGKQDLFCFDLETTSLNPRIARILGIAISWKKATGHFIIPSDTLPLEHIKKKLAPIFQSSKTKIAHNLKYDLSVLHAQALPCAGPYFDTMLAHTLVEPDQRHNMDYLAERFLGYTPIKLADVVKNIANTPEAALPAEDLFANVAPVEAPKKKKKKGDIDMTSIPAESLTDYACEDADITFQLAEILADKLEECTQDSLFYDIECPLVPVLTRMEHEGISIDLPTLSEINTSLSDKIATLTTEIYVGAGKEFNLNSPKQLGEILFGEMQLVEKPKKTKTGQFKTDEATLTSLAKSHPIIANILEYREASKLKSTYVDALPSHRCPSDQRIHTHFQQLAAATGRLASSDPNLQNIPIRTDAGRQIRKAFIPRSPEFTLLAADYSQVELRIMAALAGDTTMIEAFHNDLDIHTSTAANVFGVSHDDVTPSMRRKAKMVNFGIIYGISAFGLSQRLDIPRGEAAEIIDAYFEKYPAIRAFMDQTIEDAREKGYTKTLSGRRRIIKDIDSRNGMQRKNAERAAINTPIQGTAADMIKLAMIEVDKLLSTSDYRTKLLLQVHDELVFDLYHDEQQELIPRIVSTMENALKLPHNVPVRVDTGTGAHWLEAH